MGFKYLKKNNFEIMQNINIFDLFVFILLTFMIML